MSLQSSISSTCRSASLIPFCAVLLLAALGPVHAETFKTLMQSMAETTKAAKAALGSKDPVKSDQVMQAYASEALAATALWGDSGPKAQDLRKRFTEFAATADAASHSGGSSAFRSAFGNIVSQCRSCHAVYK